MMAVLTGNSTTGYTINKEEKNIKPRNKTGTGLPISPFLGDFWFLPFEVEIPKAEISSNLGLQSLSWGVCTSQKAVKKIEMFKTKPRQTITS